MTPYILNFNLSLFQLFIITRNSYDFIYMLIMTDADIKSIVRKTVSTFCLDSIKTPIFSA